MNPTWRIYKFYGAVFPEGDHLHIKAEFDDRVVFDGHVLTTNPGVKDISPISDFKPYSQLLFECEIDFRKYLLPLKLTVDGGMLIFGTVYGNYLMAYDNPRGAPDTTFGYVNHPVEFKKNVRIGGNPEPDYEEQGVWYWQVKNTTFECDVRVNPLLMTLVPTYSASNKRLGQPDPLPKFF